jgi:hypothetical protein
MTMRDERSIRVTTSEREDAAEGLRAAYAAGCLDNGELEERTGRAYAAKTRGELVDLVGDLPAIPAAESGAGFGPPPRRDWTALTRQVLGDSVWLGLAAVGAWPIAVLARGIAAVPLIFLWLAGLCVYRLVTSRGQGS